MKGFRKHLCLKNLKDRHRHDFAYGPELIGFKSLKRQPFQMPMVFQLPETGFDALPLMVELVKLFCRESEVRGYSVVIGADFQFSVFRGATDSSDDGGPAQVVVRSKPCMTDSYAVNRLFPGRTV